MSSDLETDPYTVKDLINVSIQNPDSIYLHLDGTQKKTLKDMGLLKKY